MNSFTNLQNHEYRMLCEISKQKEKKLELTIEQSKQKQQEIEILKLQIELEKERQKRKIETDPTASSLPQCQEYYGLKSTKFSKLF